MTAHVFFRRYADAFLQQDTAFISSVYAFPMVFFTEQGDTVSFEQEAFTQNSEKLIANYHSIGVAQVDYDVLDVQVLSEGLTMTSILWSFRDGHGEVLYHATVRYMLKTATEDWKISAVVVVDETTNFRAFLARQGEL